MNAQTASSWRPAQIAATVLFFLVLLAEGIHCYRSAHANLDSLDYVDIAESDHLNLMARAGQECVTQLPQKTSGCSALLADGGLYADSLHYTEPQLHEYLRLYRVKPLFCATLRALVRHAHMDGMHAIRTVCSISFVLIGALVWLGLRVYLDPVAAAVAGVLVLTFAQVVRLGQALTPDAMACVFLLLALYLLLYTRWLGAAIAAAVLLVLTRPENILLVTIFGLAWIAWSELVRQRKLLWSGVLLAAAAALNLGVAHFTHPVAWPAFFRTSFVEYLPPEQLSTATISVREYLHALLTTGPNSATQYLPLPLLFAALALAGGRCPLLLRRLLYVCGIVTVVRFLLYPTMDERFYTPFLIVTMVCAVVSVAQGRAAARNNS